MKRVLPTLPSIKVCPRRTGSLRPKSSQVKGAARPVSSATKRFLGILLLALLGFALFNVLISIAARNSQRKQMLSHLANLQDPLDCIFLGNSLMEAALDPGAFNRAWEGGSTPVVVNLALGATSPVEHFLILKRALDQPTHPHLIIYGFFDDQLFSETSGRWSDLVGNRALSYYFPREAAGLYAPGSWWKRWQLQLTSKIPLLAERSSPWGKVESARRWMDEVGMPKRPMNRFGRIEDFKALEAKDGPAFERRLQETLAAGPAFSRATRALIRLAGERGVQLVFVEMPMPSHHRKTFYVSSSWTRLRERMQSMAAGEHIAFVSASDWIQEDDRFEDATHLNPEGAIEFSRQLAASVRPLILRGSSPVALDR